MVATFISFGFFRDEKENKQRLQGVFRALKPGADREQAELVFLTQSHISRYLTQPAILRDPNVRALLREVCRELETRNGVTSL